MTYSRLRTSSGRKSRVPAGGLVDCLSAMRAADLEVCATIRAAHVIEAIVDVAVRVHLDLGDLRLREETLHFAGTAHHQRSRRHFHALSDQRAGSDDRPGADLRAVQHDRAHADEDTVLDRA